jgi:hypothetical protein
MYPAWKAECFHFHLGSCRTLFRTAWNRSEAEIANGKAIPADSGLIPCHSGLPPKAEPKSILPGSYPQ